jgi:hypothetical protein
MDKIKRFSSPKRTYKFPTIVGVTNDAVGILVTANFNDIIFGSLTMPLGSNPTPVDAKNGYAYLGTELLAPCKINQKYEYRLKRGSIVV